MKINVCRLSYSVSGIFVRAAQMVRQTPYFLFFFSNTKSRGFPDGAVVKNLPASAGDAREVGSIPGLGRSPGEGNGNPLQYPCLENPTDREAWWAIVQLVAKSQTWLNTAHAHVHKKQKSEEQTVKG